MPVVNWWSGAVDGCKGGRAPEEKCEATIAAAAEANDSGGLRLWWVSGGEGIRDDDPPPRGWSPRLIPEPVAKPEFEPELVLFGLVCETILPKPERSGNKSFIEIEKPFRVLFV